MVIAKGWAVSDLAVLLALPAALLPLAAARAEGEGLMAAQHIVCAPARFLQCRDWWRPCETTSVPEANKDERMRFVLAEKRLDFVHAKGVWRFGMVAEDRVEAAGRVLVVIRRPELRHRAIVFTIARDGSLRGTGDEGRFEMRGTCKAA